MWETWRREQQGAVNRAQFNQIYILNLVLHYDDKASNILSVILAVATILHPFEVLPRVTPQHPQDRTLTDD